MIQKLEQIKSLLWEEWDPIRVNDGENEWPDEYDRYANKVYVLLKSGAAKDDISRYLAQVEVDSIGMPASDIHGKVAARAVEIFRERS